MLGVILFALFTTAAVAAAAVLADSFVRGLEAFARLRRERAQAGPQGRIRVAVEDFSPRGEALPAPRAQVIRRCESRRRAPEWRTALAAAA